MSVTGVLLGFERQMILAIDGAPRAEVVVGVPRLPLDTLMARAAIPVDSIATIAVRAAAHEPVTVRVRDRAGPARALNPYTAQLIAPPGERPAQEFFSALRRWHRWVGASAAEARARAKAITGASNLAFLFLVLSGVFLWWPTRWTPAAWRTATVFQPGLKGKAREFNWHQSLGFWSAVPLAIVVATAVFISYQWPGRLLDRTLGNAEERAAAAAPRITPAAASPAQAAGRSPEAPEALRTERPAPDLERLLTLARESRPAWSAITITLATSRDTAHSILVADGNTLRPDLRHTLVLDASTYAPLAVRDYASLSTSRRIRAWVRFGHTGEVFGIPGQIVATFVTGVGAILVWTGIALSLRRLAAWRRRRKRGPLAADIPGVTTALN